MGWLVFYAVFAGAVLLFETIRQGPAASSPAWLHPAAAALAAGLLLWAWLEARAKKFGAPEDRPVIGWHLLRDVLLLPARLTLSIAGHVGARIRLGKRGRMAAWQLLEAVAEAGAMPAHQLPSEIPFQRELPRALEALQLLGWLDLHAGQEAWFYRVRSAREDELARLRGLDLQPPAESREPFSS